MIFCRIFFGIPRTGTFQTLFHKPITKLYIGTAYSAYRFRTGKHLHLLKMLLTFTTQASTFFFYPCPLVLATDSSQRNRSGQREGKQSATRQWLLAGVQGLEGWLMGVD